MQLNHLLILAGVLGASAHPSGHAHLHRAAHEKRTPSVFVKNIHHPAAASAKSSAAPAATSVAAAALPSSPAVAAASAPKGEDASTNYVPFCSEGGAPSAASKEKRVTYKQIMYVGNLGMSNGCPWNSNIMEVPAGAADKYDYIQKFTNVASEPYEVRCANKMGADSLLTGMFDVPSQKQLVFTLAPGESRHVAAEPNTQLACAFGPGSVEKTKYGQFAGNWVEADFGNASNNGWSGADCSSLVAQADGKSVPGCRVCGHGTCSTIWPGGKGENAYTIGMEALDGIGLNLPAGKVWLDVEVGFQ